LKKQMLRILLCIFLIFALSGQALAADAAPSEVENAVSAEENTQEIPEQAEPELSEETAVEPETTQSDETDVQPAPVIQGPAVYVNGTFVSSLSGACVVNQTTYLPISTMAKALQPDVQVTWANNQAEGVGTDVFLTAEPGEYYITVNGRYLYVPDGIQVSGGDTMAPIRTMALAFGATVAWDASTGNINITSGYGPLESGETFYRSDAVYWLSRIINAESGNQPIAGKIAVGTVILNRVASSRYPNTIYDVIFDCNYGVYQFSPAGTGSINKEPNEESVIAAKLCLDGAREAEGSLYFNGAGKTCWASRNRALAATIGDHSFYY